jgi:hypothetical protein
MQRIVESRDIPAMRELSGDELDTVAGGTHTKIQQIAAAVAFEVGTMFNGPAHDRAVSNNPWHGKTGGGTLPI